MPRESSVYLQVLGDGMCWSVGNQQNGVGLAHHPVSDLYLPGLPVIHSRSHGSHAQGGVVWVVQLPVPKTLILLVVVAHANNMALFSLTCILPPFCGRTLQHR